MGIPSLYDLLMFILGLAVVYFIFKIWASYDVVRPYLPPFYVDEPAFDDAFRAVLFFYSAVLLTGYIVIAYLLTFQFFYSAVPVAAAAVGGNSDDSALFILGDSSVTGTCGDYAFLMYPFLRFKPSSTYICHSLDDRRLIHHFIAEEMGLPIPPFFDSTQNGTTEDLTGGLNFGASPGLNAQARLVLERLQLLELQLGQEEAKRLIQSSLFYLSFGKEDYLHFFANLSSTQPNNIINDHEFPRMLADQMVRVLKDLYDANARKIVCMGIEPLGCSPRSRWEAYNSTGKSRNGQRCVTEINKKVAIYNRMLSASISALNSELKDSQIIFCDMYQAIMELINKPGIYGFENVDTACCGTLGTFGGMVGCIDDGMACANHSKYVWWDLYNPTEAANHWIAEWMWSGSRSSNICRPINIHRLISDDFK